MIEIVNEYANVRKLAPLASFQKNWTVTPKPDPLGIERKVKGHVSVTKGSSYLTDRKSTTTYDNPEEMLKGLHKETDKALDAYRYPDQDSFKNAEKQTARGMWSHELVRKIQQINPRLIVQDSVNVKGCAAFYKMVNGTLTYTNASFRHGWVPEFTIMKADKADLVTEFIYGWRTVLMRLVKTRDLTMAEVDRNFGRVEFGDERGKHWSIHTREFVV